MFRSSRRGLSEVVPGEAEDRVPQSPEQAARIVAVAEPERASQDPGGRGNTASPEQTIQHKW